MARRAPSEADVLISQVQEWLNSLEDNTLKLDIEESNPRKGLVEFNDPGLPNSSLFIHNDESNNTYFNIGFSQRITSASTLDDLKRSLNFVALDKLPMPGFNSPEHWSVYPMTPISSFKEGVTIHSFENNRIQYSIDTGFFAVYGNIPSRQLACGPSPPGTYLEVRRSFRGLINIDMAMSFR